MIKKIKKRISIILCALLCILLFSSCDYMPIVAYDQDLELNVRKNIIKLFSAYSFEKEEKIRNKIERDNINKEKEAELFSTNKNTSEIKPTKDVEVSHMEPTTLESTIIKNADMSISEDDNYDIEKSEVENNKNSDVATKSDAIISTISIADIKNKIIEQLGGDYEET